jgi:hypothetical protein
MARNLWGDAWLRQAQCFIAPGQKGNGDDADDAEKAGSGFALTLAHRRTLY